MSEAVRRHFLAQSALCRELGSPFTARLLALAAERLTPDSETGRAVLSWPGDPGEDVLALRFAAALQAVVLAGDAPPELARVYPPAAAGDEDLWRAVSAALEKRSAAIGEILLSPPQTNEVARSCALIGGFLTIAHETGLPLDLLEIGSSAGLNLIWDSYRFETAAWFWGDSAARLTLRAGWSGPPPPLTAQVLVANRRGCDRNPVDPSNPADILRLRSYVWADQSDRFARLDAALAVAAASGVRVERADAAEWIEARLSESWDGAVRVVFHTIVWQYLSDNARGRIRAALREAGRRTGPLAWLRLESDAGCPGAGLRLTLWPGGRTRLLARCDYHGRWVTWTASQDMGGRLRTNRL